MQNYGSAFLPAVHQGTAIGSAEIPIAKAEVSNLTNKRLSRDLQRLWPGVSFSSRLDPGEIRIPVPSADGRTIDGVFTIRTKSAFDPTSLGMESQVWIILCEAARVEREFYARPGNKV